jgi:2-dehydro-3-deoxyphosphooctonate aldolase (KDO 8-P synthase)
MKNSSTSSSLSLKSFLSKKLFFIAGPCVIESESLCLKVADQLAAAADKNKVLIIFKASWDKANRTSKTSFRGMGRESGLKVLEKVKTVSGLPILTDIHETNDIAPVAQVVDILQIPAFLCRQTDLLSMAGASGKWVNVKKGQFMAPLDMRYAIDKVGNNCLITERGTFFGYNRLVVDFAGLHDMKTLGAPVIFDATHSVQLPSGGKGCSGGNRALALPLAQAAVCQGVNGLFFEVHPNPDNALCDGPNSLNIKDFVKSIRGLMEIQAICRVD